MWLLAVYAHTSLFSLKNSAATSSGAKTNLVPTMYAVKMALVDAAFRLDGEGAEAFDLVKALPVRFRPPEYAVVNNTMVKILRQPKDLKAGPPFISSVAYRELAFFGGDLTVAVGVAGLREPEVARLRQLLLHVNHFGKRGSFVQLKGFEEVAEPGPAFSFVAGDGTPSVGADLIVQHLDDVGPRVSFEAVNTYSDSPARLGRDRVLVPVALPYRKLASSRGYTLFRRTA